MPPFAARVVAWQRRHGRHDLPWQRTRDAWPLWVSEIMLQQTQVAAVVPYFEAFIARFPDVQALAAAEPDAVLAHWAGLGYYARARLLHRAAREVVAHHGGVVPTDAATLATLPGIGRSTAAAIAAFAAGERGAILDGNVKRVLARHAGIDGWPGRPAVERALWARAEACLPPHPAAGEIEAYTQGLMDLGNLVCTRSRPACTRCPVAADCVARRDGRTAQLPTPRPARVTPQRETWMLLLVTADARVRLVRRPPSGVWGGLWCPPEIDGPHAAVACGLAHGVAIDPQALHERPPIEHAFTHFRLRIRPLQVDAARMPARTVEDDGARWVGFDALSRIALPAPVKTLLAAVDPTPFSLA